MNLSQSLFDKVVQNQYCIGCGVCAGVCPRAYISMSWGESGIYQPSLSQVCELENCNLCATSCPFWNQEHNEDSLAQRAFGDTPGILHDELLGFYLGTYAGYARTDQHRENGSSGGLATWLLETLLTSGSVDHVVCVSPTPNSDAFFQFRVVSDVQELRAASRSCYYPVTMEQVIKFIIRNPGNFAVTGVPCFLKGLRLAMLRHKKLSKIKYMLGLVCGQTQTRQFVDYVYGMAGGDPAQLSQVTFRVKDANRPASDFAFRFQTLDGQQDKLVFWSEGIGEAWGRGYFRPEACNYCDDVFAETADITFMDAWLPEYKSDYRGTNLVVIRNEIIRDLMMTAERSELIEFTPIDASRLIRSQRDVVYKKRHELALRLYDHRRENYVPVKRVSAGKAASLKEIILYRSKEALTDAGRRAATGPRKEIFNQVTRKVRGLKNLYLFELRMDRLLMRIKKRITQEKTE